MKALIIVDVQNDFLPGGALAIKSGNEIIPIINELQHHFDVIVATKDWHPPDHMSFATRHNKAVGDVVEVFGIRQELWPNHCVQGTPGAKFSPDLETERIEQIFYKGIDSNIDSYSAFFDNAHLRSTGLADYLKKKGVDEIYIVGLATDYCVKYSVLDARRLGFKTYVIIDGCRGIEINPGDIEKAIEDMKAAGAHILHCHDIY